MDVSVSSSEDSFTMDTKEDSMSIGSSQGGPNSSPSILSETQNVMDHSSSVDIKPSIPQLNMNMNINDKTGLMAVMGFLRKHSLKNVEETLRKETGMTEADLKLPLPSDTEVQNVLSSYASDENPDEYTDAYNQLKNFIDSNLDAYKFEIGQVLWPVFVHMYLELVYNEHETQAKTFFIRFSKMQETFYEKDLITLGSIMKKDHLVNYDHPFKPLLNSCLTGGKGSSLYVVRMCREAQNILKRFLQESRCKLIQSIVQDRIFIEVYDGLPRGKAAISAISGHIMGEALRIENKTKVYYGLLREPDLQNVYMDEDDEEGGGGNQANQGESQNSQSSQKTENSAASSSTAANTSQSEKSGGSSSKKKKKKDWLLSKKGKNDPNAPPLTRMPLPELRDADKIEKAKGLREASKRVTLSTERLPSTCFYTVLNGDQKVTVIKWSEDGTLLGIGFASSLIKIWSMTPQKLKKLKPASELIEIDRESDDVLVRMMDDRSGETSRNLRGHYGSVCSLEFSPDKTNLLSSSDDCSIRLWSLQTWSCLVVYRGHLFPVWKVVFSPHGGYYFASAGHDRTARLWTTDNYSALRVFAGHYSDVTTILFHPNSNYLATGSSDRSVRLWDCVSGSCVRLMTGHKGSIQTLCFSIDGRFLISGCTSAKVNIWDLANGGLLNCLTLHKSAIYSIAFSREGNLLATAGQDQWLRLWDFTKMTEDIIGEESGAVIPPDVKKINGDHLLVAEYKTKNTPIFSIHFTRRNILLGSGPYNF